MTIAFAAAPGHAQAMCALSIAVFGSGGVGGYFGGRLAEAGEDVRFIARGRHLAAIREHGLRISSVDGDFVVHPPRVSDDPAALGPVDVVLLGVKAWQVPEAAHALRPLVGERTFVVPLQNGIEAPEQLVAEIGEERVLGGLAASLRTSKAPGTSGTPGSRPTSPSASWTARAPRGSRRSGRRSCGPAASGGGAARHRGRDVEQVPVHHGAQRGRGADARSRSA